MNKATKVMGAAVGGVAGGFALAFLLCAATAVIAISTGADASLPGVFWAKAGTENDALALEFQPNFVGIMVVVALTAVVSALLAARHWPKVPGNTGRI
jgi:ABC-type antimicrobial peptide transport system permease subunit